LLETIGKSINILILPDFLYKRFDKELISYGDHADILFFYNFKINIHTVNEKE
jgi:hypothetical protein